MERDRSLCRDRGSGLRGRNLASDIDFCRSRTGDGDVRRLREMSIRGVRESIERRESGIGEFR